MSDERSIFKLTLVAGQGLAKASTPADQPAPQEEQGSYLYLNFRALSAAFVVDYATDFSDVAVLKKAVPMLVRRPVLTDHWRSISGVVGTVVQTWWGQDDGLGVPGINCRLRLNRDSVPANLLAEIEADPPLHLAVSVTPYFYYQQSHPDLSPQQFQRLMGSELDGQIVRMVVTEISEMPEISLVWAGADPRARLLELNKPNEGRSDMSGANNNGGAPGVGAQAVSLAALAPLATTLGLTAEQSADQQGLVSHLQAKVGELLPLAKAGRVHLEARRKEALRLAGLSAPENKVTEHMEKMVAEASLESVEALIQQFGGKVAASFTAVCPHCQKEVPVRSSLEKEPPAEGNDKYREIGLRMAKSAGGGREA